MELRPVPGIPPSTAPANRGEAGLRAAGEPFAAALQAALRGLEAVQGTWPEPRALEPPTLLPASAPWMVPAAPVLPQLQELARADLNQPVDAPTGPVPAGEPPRAEVEQAPAQAPAEADAAPAADGQEALHFGGNAAASPPPPPRDPVPDPPQEVAAVATLRPAQPWQGGADPDASTQSRPRPGGRIPRGPD